MFLCTLKPCLVVDEELGMPVHTYNNGKPYNIAQGRAGDRVTIVDRKSTVHPIVRGRPNSDEFVRVAKQELKIRAYRQSTIKNYLSCWVIATSTQRQFTLGPPISRSAKPLAHWIGSFRNKQPTAAILMMVQRQRIEPSVQCDSIWKLSGNKTLERSPSKSVQEI